MPILLLASFLTACDRRPVPKPAPPPPAADALQIMELRTLVQLLPDRATHITADLIGNVYWTQESDDGRDVLFVAGEDDSVRSTNLTSAAIIAAMGPAPAAYQPGGKFGATPPVAPTIAKDGSGTIQSIISDPNGGILLFFNGGVGRSTRTCVARYDPRNGTIGILADTQSLSAASEMGTSIGLARGKILAPASVPKGQPARYWLWLHHSDSAFLFRFNPAPIETGSPIDISHRLDQLTIDGASRPLASDAFDFFTAAEGGLLMHDTRAAALWHVDENGATSGKISLVGLPNELSDPAGRGEGAMFLFVGDGEPATGIIKTDDLTEDFGPAAIMPSTQPKETAQVLSVRYPALLTLLHNQLIPTALREDIHGPTEVQESALKLREFVRVPGASGWVTYDATSGQLMRMRLLAKD